MATDERLRSGKCRITIAIRAATADALVVATTPSRPASIPTITVTPSSSKPSTPLPPPLTRSFVTADAVKDEVDRVIATFGSNIFHSVQGLSQAGGLPIVESWDLANSGPAPLAVGHKERIGSQQLLFGSDASLHLQSSPSDGRKQPPQAGKGDNRSRARDSAVELSGWAGETAETTSITPSEGAEAKDLVDFFRPLVGSDGGVKDKRTSLRAVRWNDG